MDRYTPLLGRLTIATVFIAAGLGKLASFSTTNELLSDQGLGDPSFLLLAIIAAELAGGVMLALGDRTRLTAKLLFAYVAGVTLFMHHDVADKLNATLAVSNLGLLGGLALLAAYGAPFFSVDAWRTRRDAVMAAGRTLDTVAV